MPHKKIMHVQLIELQVFLFLFFSKFRSRTCSSEPLGLSPVTSTVFWLHYNFTLLCNVEQKGLNRVMFSGFTLQVLQQSLHSVLKSVMLQVWIWDLLNLGFNCSPTSEASFDLENGMLVCDRGVEFETRWASLPHPSRLNVSLKILGYLKNYTTGSKVAWWKLTKSLEVNCSGR